jgi:glycosyltransferase involved in cell wall biosynthesis/peptidoglycan/xylan/chitin deacetylase (PgdA/CDA1 family)
MDYVRRNFDVISFRDLLAIEDQECTAPRRPLIVTFDDGYRDNYTQAFPVLKEFGIPATVFVATGHMGRQSLFWWDLVAFCFKTTQQPEITLDEISPHALPLATLGDRRRAIERVLAWIKEIPDDARARFARELPVALGVAMPPDLALGMHLSWDEIREMADRGIEFGSHTVTHPILSNVEDGRLEKEVFNSKAELERELKREILVFSYPVGGAGNFQSRTIASVARAGYRYAVSYVEGVVNNATNRLAMPRIHVEADHSLNLFRANLRFPGLMLQKPAPSIATEQNTIQERAILGSSPVEAKGSTKTREPACSEVNVDNCQIDSGLQAAGRPSRLRVMQVTWSLVAGGSEMYAYKIARGLDAQRYKAFICAVDQGGALEPEIAASGIPYFVMNRRPGIHLGMMWRLFRLFQRTRVDVVQTHHFNQLFYSAFAATLAGARIIHTEHSIEYLKSRKYRLALRLLSRLCHRVVAIGTEGANFLRDRVGIPTGKIELIRAGVDVEPERYDDSLRLKSREGLGLGAQDRVAVIIARLFPEKNHALLLEAFRAVAAAVPVARLLIVGEGTERARVEKSISDLGLNTLVQVLGVRRDVADILAASDLFVLSSDREGLPIAVLEAMAASKPVVATAVGDLPRLISDGVTGRLVPPRDPAALVDAILSVLGDPESAKRMGSSARALVNRSFSLRSMIDSHQALFA